MVASAVEVARYASMRQYDASILDTFIPRCRRLTQLHFGRIVSNPDAPQAFSTNVGFNMTYNLVEPFKGNALHTHPAVEVFIALDGCWEIAWGEKGEHTTLLQPWDIVAVPAHVRHSYKNVEAQTANHIMTILPGKAAITWAPDVVSEARANGAHCTNKGQLLGFWKGNKSGDAAPAEPETEDEDEPDAYHVPMGKAEMAENIRRFSDGRPLCVQAENSHLKIDWRTLSPGEQMAASRSAVDVLLVVLEGTLMLTRPSGEVFTVASQLDSVRVPAEETAITTAANQLGSPCTLLVIESHMRSLVDRLADEWIVSSSVDMPFSSSKRHRTDACAAYPVRGF